MTDHAVLPQFAIRSEGDGFIVFLATSQSYLYADANAGQALAELRDGIPAQEVAVKMSASQGTGLEEALAFIESLYTVLSGTAERIGEVTGVGPYLGPLSDLVGNSADRCETFGMPL